MKSLLTNLLNRVKNIKITSRSTVKFFDKMEDYLVLLVCFTVLLTGCYSFYDTYKVYNDVGDNELLKFKPGSNEEVDKPITKGMVAWLTIDAIKDEEENVIDYPVMQGENNQEYLNLNPYGEYSLSGSIFLDSRNSADFSDDYSLIYGHHMEGGAMFGKLDAFLDKDFFDKHRTGSLTLAVYDETVEDAKERYSYTTEYKLKIFAVVESIAENDALFAPVDTSASTTWSYIKSNATYLDMSGINERDRLLGLSTCKYPDTTERAMVFAVIQEG